MTAIRNSADFHQVRSPDKYEQDHTPAHSLSCGLSRDRSSLHALNIQNESTCLPRTGEKIMGREAESRHSSIHPMPLSGLQSERERIK
jgi:hypothetical protein